MREDLPASPRKYQFDNGNFLEESGLDKKFHRTQGGYTLTLQYFDGKVLMKGKDNRVGIHDATSDEEMKIEEELLFKS